jgi:transposase-like protein
MANLTKLTREKEAAFLDVLARGGSVTKAARTVGLSRQAMYQRRDADAQLAARWDAAWQEGIETLEDEGIRRATEGVTKEKGVYFRGDLVATEVEINYSDTLLMFFLKGRKPDTYRDNASVKLSGDASAPIVTQQKADPDAIRAAELAYLAARPADA